MSKQCVWTQEDFNGDCWDTSCAGLFSLNEGTPSEHGENNQQAAREWLPIESAPRDGTIFIAYGKPCSGQRLGAYETYYRPYGYGSPAEAMFRRGDGPEGAFWYEESNWIQGWNPTHWMPLPAPPRPTQERSDEQG